MEKILYLTMLYDFYGGLLTKKQKNIFELYHLNDLSLYEISGILTISRQAVLDSVKRTENLLMQYEKELLLVDKYLKRKTIIKDTLNLIEKNVSYNLFLSIKKNIDNLLD